MIDAYQLRILSRFGLARIRVLIVVMRKLAIVQLRRERQGALRRVRNLHPEMRRIGRAGGNQPHVQQAARLERVALVDRIAIRIELVGLVEMRALLNGPVVGFSVPAPVDDLAVGVLTLQFQPNIEGIDGPAGEEVADLARPHDNIQAYGRPWLELRACFIEGRGHLTYLADQHLPAGLLGLFADCHGGTQGRRFTRPPPHFRLRFSHW